MGRTVLMVGVVENRELAVRTALESGLRLAVIDFADSPIIQLAHLRLPVHNLFDLEELRGAFGRLPEPPDGVLTFYDELMEPTAAFAEKAGCRFLSREAARLAVNKAAQRDALTRAGLPCPRWHTCDSFEQCASAARTAGYPVVLKTADQAGAIGKVRVPHEGALAAAYEVVSAARLDPSVPLLVEEQVVGPEYSVEGYVHGGRLTPFCVTEKTTLSGPYPVEAGHALPYRGPHERPVTETAAAALRALAVDDTLVHVEVFMTSRGPVIVEVNARSAGDRLMDLVDRRAGCNPYRVAFDLALGRTPAWTPRWQGAEAVAWALPGREGVLEGVDGVPEVLAEPSLTGMGFDALPGTLLPPEPEHSGHRLCWVSCAGADQEEAARRVRRTVARLVPRIVPAPEAGGANDEEARR